MAPEQEARAEIDKLMTAAGWSVEARDKVDLTAAHQQQTADELDARSTELNWARAVLAGAYRQSDRLRQTIRTKAFSGQFVPQDSNDEPASVLLERIRAERERGETAGSKPRRAKPRSVSDLPG